MFPLSIAPSSIKLERPENCLVCGAPEAKYHYQGLCCNRCRVFFIRAARLGRPFKCRLTNCCEIVHESSLKCSACRLKKCVAIGMTMDDVGSSRKSSRFVVGYFKERDMLFSNAICSLTTHGPKVIPHLEGAKSPSEYATLRINFDRYSDGWTGGSPSTQPVNLDISLTDLLLNPGLCSSRTTAALDQFVQQYIGIEVNFYHSRSFGRIATSFADFMTSIPEFHELQLVDKLRLCQYNYHSYVMYKTFYTKYQFHMRKQKLNQIAGKQILEGAPPAFFNTIISKIVQVAAGTVETAFMENRINDIESLFLLMITVLSAPVTLTESGQTITRRASTKYISMLAKYLEESFSPIEGLRIYRIRQLLSTIPSIKELGGMFSQAHIVMVANNWGAMGSRLPLELHITEF